MQQAMPRADVDNLMRLRRSSTPETPNFTTQLKQVRVHFPSIPIVLCLCRMPLLMIIYVPQNNGPSVGFAVAGGVFLCIGTGLPS